MTISDPLEQELLGLEENLLREDVRTNAEAMGHLLAAEFLEFGSSGRMFDRAAVLASLPLESPARFHIHAFAARLLGSDIALTTYRLSWWGADDATARETLRSSIWVKRDGRWQMVFHQGTPAGAGDVPAGAEG